jgi:hypothetical protein
MDCRWHTYDKLSVENPKLSREVFLGLSRVRVLGLWTQTKELLNIYLACYELVTILSLFKDDSSLDIPL